MHAQHYSVYQNENLLTGANEAPYGELCCQMPKKLTERKGWKRERWEGGWEGCPKSIWKLPRPFCNLAHFTTDLPVIYRFWQLNSSFWQLTSYGWQINSSLWLLNSSLWLLNSSCWQLNSSLWREISSF